MEDGDDEKNIDNDGESDEVAVSLISKVRRRVKLIGNLYRCKKVVGGSTYGIPWVESFLDDMEVRRYVL